MIELTVGLVGLLVVLGALLQIASLASARTDAMFRARREAGTRAMSGAPTASSAALIRSVEEGPDRSRFSADDTYTAANGATLFAPVLAASAGDAAQRLALDAIPGNEVSALLDSPAPGTQLGLIEGRETVRVPLLPVVRNLLYDADEIELECSAWMPWARGIY
jgi:hypothetical protein